MNSREISFQNKKIKLTEKEIEIILFLNSSDKERTVEELKKSLELQSRIRYSYSRNPCLSFKKKNKGKFWT